MDAVQLVKKSLICFKLCASATLYLYHSQKSTHTTVAQQRKQQQFQLAKSLRQRLSAHIYEFQIIHNRDL